MHLSFLFMFKNILCFPLLFNIYQYLFVLLYFDSASIPGDRRAIQFGIKFHTANNKSEYIENDGQ